MTKLIHSCSFLCFLGWCETVSTCYVDHCLAYWTIHGWLMMMMMMMSGAVSRIGRRNQSTRRKEPQCQFVHHKSHMTCPGFEPWPPRWKRWVHSAHMSQWPAMAYRRPDIGEASRVRELVQCVGIDFVNGIPVRPLFRRTAGIFGEVERFWKEMIFMWSRFAPAVAWKG